MESAFYAPARGVTLDVAAWDVQSVTDMARMFLGASTFDGDLGSWDVSNVRTMKDMFWAAACFNQDIGEWRVENVEDMRGMFVHAAEFKRDLTNWTLRQAPGVQVDSIFEGCPMKDATELWPPAMKKMPEAHSKTAWHEW
jgi:hypothetical protein